MGSKKISKKTAKKNPKTQKGVKYGGRKKGTPNKKTFDAKLIADKMGIDPFECLMHFVTGNAKALNMEETTEKVIGNTMIEVLTITPEMRLQATKEACSYLYPKRKAIEGSLETQVNAGDVIKRVLEKIA